MAQTNERRKNMATTAEPTPEPPATQAASTPAFRAAQYVRMSTDTVSMEEAVQQIEAAQLG